LSGQLYHIGFGRADLGNTPPTAALLCGDPQRAARITRETDWFRSRSRRTTAGREKRYEFNVVKVDEEFGQDISPLLLTDVS
jgi:uridine phosphorylase